MPFSARSLRKRAFKRKSEGKSSSSVQSSNLPIRSSSADRFANASWYLWRLPGVRNTVVTRANRKVIFHQVAPTGVFLLDQFNLPCPAPILHLALTRFGVIAGRKVRIPDEAAALVLCRKAGERACFVLPSPSCNIVSMADIKRPVLHTGRDVNIEHTITPDLNVPTMFFIGDQVFRRANPGLSGRFCFLSQPPWILTFVRKAGTGLAGPRDTPPNRFANASWHLWWLDGNQIIGSSALSGRWTRWARPPQINAGPLPSSSDGPQAWARARLSSARQTLL